MKLSSLAFHSSKQEPRSFTCIEALTQSSVWNKGSWMAFLNQNSRGSFRESDHFCREALYYKETWNLHQLLEACWIKFPLGKKKCKLEKYISLFFVFFFPFKLTVAALSTAEALWLPAETILSLHYTWLSNKPTCFQMFFSHLMAISFQICPVCRQIIHGWF